MTQGGFSVEYVWNDAKNEKNFAKHGVWFEEASTVFADLNALEIFDEDRVQNSD